jgi:hypothetical protein
MIPVRLTIILRLLAELPLTTSLTRICGTPMAFASAYTGAAIAERRDVQDLRQSRKLLRDIGWPTARIRVSWRSA